MPVKTGIYTESSVVSRPTIPPFPYEELPCMPLLGLPAKLAVSLLARLLTGGKNVRPSECH
jgi:hypothetical protein